jgi:hypothetical protein
VRAVHAALVELSETQTRLLARHALLSTILARRFNNRIVVPSEVADVSVPDAGREMAAIDRQLAAIARCIDAQYGPSRWRTSPRRAGFSRPRCPSIGNSRPRSPARPFSPIFVAAASSRSR